MQTALSAEFIQKLQLLDDKWPEKRFLIAYSGGLDSTALLCLAVKFLPSANLAAAHLNHQLRAADSLTDEEFARRLAGKFNLHFISDSAPVAVLAKKRKKGLEEAARYARYNFLLQAAAAWSADYIVTAHQADDQAETILMNLLKGTGPKGLSGIPEITTMKRAGQTACIWRPLLGQKRQVLAEFLKEEGQAYREDSSNLDSRFLRNQIRLELLPLLKSINPLADQALLKLADILKEENSFWQKRVERLFTELCFIENAGLSTIKIKIKKINFTCLELCEKRRLLHYIFTRIWQSLPNPSEPISFKTIEMALVMMKAPFHHGQDLPGGLRLAHKKEQIIVSLNSRILHL